MAAWSVIRLSVSMIPVAVAAYFFFGFNLLDLGLPLVAFFAVLVLTSWSLGLISAGVEANVIDKPGGIFVRPAQQIPQEDRILLQ